MGPWTSASRRSGCSLRGQPSSHGPAPAPARADKHPQAVPPLPLDPVRTIWDSPFLRSPISAKIGDMHVSDQTPSSRPKRAVAYLRVSTRQQAQRDGRRPALRGQHDRPHGQPLNDFSENFRLHARILAEAQRSFQRFVLIECHFLALAFNTKNILFFR